MTPAAAPISRGGQVSLSRLAHYQEYRRGGADPRYQGLFAPSKYASTAYSSPRYRNRVFTALTRILWVSTTTGINGDDMWLAENAIQGSEVKPNNRLATPMTYK